MNIRWDLLPETLTFLGGLALTWPALRAGRVLGQAQKNAELALTDEDPTAKGIFDLFSKAYTAKSWKKSDQRWLIFGLLLSVAGGFIALVNHYRNPVA